MDTYKREAMTTKEVDLKLPFVSHGLLEHLEKNFSTESILAAQRDKPADYTVGYLNAVADVLNNLRCIVQQQEGNW